MVDDPAVIAEARREDVSTKPQRVNRDGLTGVIYRRTRVYIDRQAWEMLADGGVFILQVRPTESAPFALAFTNAELEQVFGEARETPSWAKARNYSFPAPPDAVASFIVNDHSHPPAGEGPGQRISSPTPTPPPEPRPVVVEPVERPDRPSRIAWSYHRCVERGVPPEPDVYLAAVEEWRNIWRPARVKALLVAESHVREVPGDTSTRLRLRTGLPTRRILPTSFVRLIYCLGYGERSICVPSQAAANPGTDFWEFFRRLALPADERPRTPWSMPRSLTEKVQILERLAERGIWLEDASPCAIYVGNNQRMPKSEAMVQKGCKKFVWPEIQHDAPERIWVVWKTVYDTLLGLDDIEEGRWFYQPRGAKRRGLEAKYHEQVESMCQDLDEVAP